MATTKLPTVQLPTGVTPSPQAITSQETLKKMKEGVLTPVLPIGAKLSPQ